MPGDVCLLDRGPLTRWSDVPADLTTAPYVVPLFTPGNRQYAAQEAGRRGFSEAYSLIDATAICPRSLQHGPGLYVNSGCILGAGSRFDEFVFINRGVSLGHHAELSAFVSIGPGAVIAGMVRMGKGAMVGTGAVVLPKISIGANAVVGAGAVVTKNVPDHCLVAGNPARILNDSIRGYGDRTVS